MVTSYNGSAVLKTYRLTSDEEKSYILGFPYILSGKTKGKDTAYTDFSKTVIKNIKRIAFNRGSLELIIEQAANSAVESNSWNFGESEIQDGFFFPKMPNSTCGNLETVKKYLKSNELVMLRYLSARIGSSGNPVLVKKIYVGRITGLSEDQKVATLQLGESDYRSFHINQMIVLSGFSDKLSDGEMLYLHVKLAPREKGGTLLTWVTLRGESHPLLTQPFHENADTPKREELLREVKDDSQKTKRDKATKGKKSVPFDEFLIPREGEVDWDGLEKHLGKFVRVEVYSKDLHESTHYFKLRKMVYTPEYKRLLLEGERVSIEQPIQNLVIASVKRKK